MMERFKMSQTIYLPLIIILCNMITFVVVTPVKISYISSLIIITSNHTMAKQLKHPIQTRCYEHILGRIHNNSFNCARRSSNILRDLFGIIKQMLIASNFLWTRMISLWLTSDENLILLDRNKNHLNQYSDDLYFCLFWLKEETVSFLLWETSMDESGHFLNYNVEFCNF